MCLPASRDLGSQEGLSHIPAPIDLRDQNRRPRPQLRPLCIKASLEAQHPHSSGHMSPSMTPLLILAVALLMVHRAGLSEDPAFSTTQLTLG